MYEDLTVRSVTYNLESALIDEEMHDLKESIDSLPGIKLTVTAGSAVTIEYYAEIISDSLIKEAVTESGLKLAVPKKRGRLARAIERMADKNRKTFGEGRLDCCDLNRE